LIALTPLQGSYCTVCGEAHVPAYFDRFAALFSSKITVIPVPLRTRKQAQRGFNRAEMLARDALKQLSRPKRFDRCPGVLLRRREVGSQIGLTRHQRRENMRGAFAVSDPTRILNRDILLIDDVYTTGTTASEFARGFFAAREQRGCGWRQWLEH